MDVAGDWCDGVRSGTSAAGHRTDTGVIAAAQPGFDELGVVAECR